MKLESPKVTVSKSQQDVFDFLSDVKNFEQLMPETINKFEVLEKDKFLFMLKGMPEIILKKKDVTEPTQITLGAASSKLDFNLLVDIQEEDEEETEVGLTFTGTFNTMMAMMIKSPIKKFIATLVNNLEDAMDE